MPHGLERDGVEWLRGRAVHVDCDACKDPEDLKSLLREAGASVRSFFDAEVELVVTNRPTQRPKGDPSLPPPTAAPSAASRRPPFAAQEAAASAPPPPPRTTAQVGYERALLARCIF